MTGFALFTVASLTSGLATTSVILIAASKKEHPMNLEHVTVFTAAMQRKDLEAMLSHMAGDVVLNTPLMAEPVRGKDAIR
jgi:hypothetical protein